MKRDNMKILAIITCLVLCITALAGCGTQAGENAPAASSSAPVQSSDPEASSSGHQPFAEKVTLTYLVDNQTQLDGFNAVTAEIEKRYNIHTEVELRPGGADGDNLVKTRLATGEMSDLCAYNSGSLFRALNPEQYFVDLTNEPFMDNVIDSFKPTVSVNGKVYGIPNGATMTGAWLYNKKVYAELGLSVPKTWAELMANCEKVKSAGKIPVIGGYQDSWTAQLIVLADFYNVLQEVPTFAEDFTANKAKLANTPAALRSFQKLREVYDKGYINEDLFTTTYETALKKLAEGEGAHYPMLTFALSAINGSYPELANDIGLFGQPGDSADKSGITVWMPGGVYVSNASKNIEAAKIWCEFFTTAEAMEIYSKAQKPDGPFAIKGAALPDDVLPAVKDMLPYFESGKTAPALEFLSPIKGPNLPQICAEVGGGIMTAEDGAKVYDADCEKQAKQLGIAGW